MPIDAAVLDDVLSVLGYDDTNGLVRFPTGSQLGSRGFVWHELHTRGGVDAAYFSGAVPLVAFTSVEDEAGAAIGHRRLWNLGRVPVLVTVSPERVEAYSCFVGPDRDGGTSNAKLAEAQHLDVSELLSDFARVSVDRGRLSDRWSARFRPQDRVDRRLLENLRGLREALGGEGLRRRVLDRVVGRAIFVRYFEDRGVLNQGLMETLVGRSTLIDVLDDGVHTSYRLFGSLAARFNGDVFGSEAEEEQVVSDADVRMIADFFRGTDIRTGQHVFWPYDFSVIPSELISSIYEQLLEEDQIETAAYYTPRPVVDLILDEVLPWNYPTNAPPRILDPACGSGIFLTEAFRRLVYQRKSIGDPLTFEALSSTLRSSIFGVDLSDAAVSVAALGLYLALLEHVDPPTVWRDAHLPPLVGTNLLVADYFDDHDLAQESFDIVVGNPPWKSSLTTGAAHFVSDHGREIADRQSAIAFVWRAAEQLAPSGKLGLLMPAKPLLHNQSAKAVRARRQIFTELDVETVVDLSLLRRGLFHGATAPAAVLVAGVAMDSPAGVADHAAPRASPLQSMIDGFVVSQSDVHIVPRSQAEGSSWIWKVLAWAGLEDFALVSRLRIDNPSLRDVCVERGWRHSRGYQVEGGDENDASHMLGRLSAEAEAILPFRLDSAALTEVANPVMHRPRPPEIYAGAQALFRIGMFDGSPAAVAIDQGMCFTDSVFGISGDRADFDLLRLAVACTNSSLGRYFHFLTSPSWGIERNYLGSAEFLRLPIPMETGEAAEEVLRCAELLASQSSSATWDALDTAVFSAYGLDEVERKLVLDRVRFQLDEFRMGVRSASFYSPDDEALRRYESALGRDIGDVLGPNVHDIWVSDAENSYRVVSIGIAPSPGRSLHPPGVSIIDGLLHQAEGLPAENQSPVIVLQPTLTVLDGHFVHVVKPDEAKSWTESSAHTDASNVIGAIAASPSVS